MIILNLMKISCVCADGGNELRRLVELASYMVFICSYISKGIEDGKGAMGLKPPILTLRVLHRFQFFTIENFSC